MSGMFDGMFTSGACKLLRSLFDFELMCEPAYFDHFKPSNWNLETARKFCPSFLLILFYKNICLKWFENDTGWFPALGKSGFARSKGGIFVVEAREILWVEYTRYTRV